MNQNFYRILYACIQIILIAATFLIGHYIRIRYGAVCFIWLLGNVFFYEEGSIEYCIDEYETGYPKDGVSNMFKHWSWLLPALGIFTWLMIVGAD